MKTVHHGTWKYIRETLYKIRATLTSDNDPVLLGLMENALTNGDAGRVGCVRDGDIPWLAKSNKLLLNPLSLEAELLSCEM